MPLLYKGNSAIYSVYECDRCKEKMIGSTDVYKIEYKRFYSTYYGFKTKKHYYLCRTCYARIHRYLVKGDS